MARAPGIALRATQEECLAEAELQGATVLLRDPATVPSPAGPRALVGRLRANVPAKSTPEAGITLVWIRLRELRLGIEDQPYKLVSVVVVRTLPGDTKPALDGELRDNSVIEASPHAPAPPPPAAHIALFAAHDALLHDSVDWLDSTRIQMRTIGDRMLILLTARILQLGTALQRLCEAGHAGEAAPTVRAMVSACVILVYIAEDRDGRSAAYMEAERNQRRRSLADIKAAQDKAIAEGSSLFISSEAMASIEQKLAEVAVADDRMVANLARHGVVPTKLGSRADTFSGLNNERDLFERMGRLRWYLSYYKSFSDEVHVGASALYTEVVEQMSGQNLIGAKFEDPLYLMVASSETVLNALEQVDRAFDLHQDAGLKAIDDRMTTALVEFSRASGD